VGVSAATRATPHIEVCEGVPAAIAVLNEVGAVKRATRAFLDTCDLDGAHFAGLADAARMVIEGAADRLTVPLEDVEVELVAVADPLRRRAALLEIPTAHDPAGTGADSPVFEERLDDSPAVVWLKDLDGGYLSVNRRYVEALEVDPASVRGRTDAELTPAESIEGLRLEEHDAAGWDHLELEYRIGAFEERPAFAALRFALHDGGGSPIATCSVAAPVAEAAVARAECERLMRIDRCARLDAVGVRQELLDEWGLTLADGLEGAVLDDAPLEGAPLDADESEAAALGERDQALATAARLEQQLAEERGRRDGLEAESQRLLEGVNEREGSIAAERARAGELEQSLAASKAHVDELDAALTTLRAEVQEHALAAEQAVAAVKERDAALTTLRAEVQEHALAAEQAVAAVVERDAALATLRAEVQEHALAAEQAVSAAAERDAAHEKLAGLERELAEQRERRDGVQVESERASERVAELQGAVAAEQARAGELELALADAEARIGALEAQVVAERAAHENEIDAARAQAASIEQDLARAEERSSELGAELAAGRAGQQEALTAATTRADELTRSLAAAQARVSELEAASATRGAEADDRAAAVLAERARSSDLERLLARAEARAGELENRITAAGVEHAADVASQRARAESIEAQLAGAEVRSSELETELVRSRAAQAAAVTAAQERSEELARSLSQANARAEELEAELQESRELESQPLQSTPESGAQDPVETSHGPTWNAGAQRSLSAALVDVTEWRVALKRVIDTLGAEGGWDAGIAWSTDEPRRPLRCDAIWTSEPGSLGTLETRAWQQRQDCSTAEFGRARARMAATCLLELASAEDPLLRGAADQGFHSALLVPISVGGEAVAMLELLSRDTAPPSAELMVSVDAVALQLGVIAQLIKVANVPRWRTGRV
jgi:PAS domain-containing protein